MSTNKKVSRILGVAFLLQFVTSFSSGSFIQPAWLVVVAEIQLFKKLAYR